MERRLIPVLPLLLMLAACVVFGSTVFQAVVNAIVSIRLPF